MSKMGDRGASLATFPVEIVHVISKDLIDLLDMRDSYIFDFTALNALVGTCRYFHVVLNETLYRTAIEEFEYYNKHHLAAECNPPRRLSSHVIKSDNANALKNFLHYGLSYRFRMVQDHRPHGRVPWSCQDCPPPPHQRVRQDRCPLR